MSSMAWQAIEMGIDPCIGPDFQTWDGPGKSFYEGYEDNYEKKYKDDYISYKKEKTWFKTAQEAQEYAKANPGIVITRSPDGNGYIVKK